MTTLIVGCGYLGRRVGRLLRAQGERVWGTSRSVARARELAEWDIEPILADVLRPETLEALPAAERLVYCVGFDRTAGASMRTVYVEGVRNVLDRVAGPVDRLVYASSTGVYGQDDGGWVDENSPTEPRHESGLVMLEAENVVRSYAGPQGLPAVILRFSGLYGPGRLVRRSQLERGEAILGDPEKYLNLIHVDDAARVTVAALERGEPGQVYLASDDRPITRRQYYGSLAEELHVPPPRFEAPLPSSPEARRDEANKRISNRKIHTDLRFDLRYPDITTGLVAALAPP
jgi:nucleoside-diphosphate-sugar epimerase